MWWAVVTVTTVGYGDKFPVTEGGRAVAIVLMLVGIGLIGTLTASVASFFVEEGADRDRRQLEQRLERMEQRMEQMLQRLLATAPGAEPVGEPPPAGNAVDGPP